MTRIVSPGEMYVEQINYKLEQEMKDMVGSRKDMLPCELLTSDNRRQLTFAFFAKYLSLSSG